MMNLDNWQLIEYAEIVIDDGEREALYRLTFKTMTALDEAMFNRRRTECLNRLSEVYGEYSEADDETKFMADTLFTLMVKHAGAMASLKSIEVQDDKGAWESASVPDEWRDTFEFAQNAPAGIIDYLFRSALMAGNTLRVYGFNVVADDDAGEKKAFRLNVNAPKSES